MIDSARVLRVYFIGRLQGIITPDYRPWKHFRIENARLGEQEAFDAYPGLVRSYSIRKSDIIYVRNKPESTTEWTRRQIEKRLARHGDGKYVINPISAFAHYNAKNATFDRWREVGLRVPDYTVFEDHLSSAQFVERVQDFLARHDEIFLRTNDDAAGKGMTVLRSDAPDAQIEGEIRDLAARRHERRAQGTALMAVERIHPPPENEGVMRIFRAHVYEDEILGGYGLAGRHDVIHARDMQLPELDDFIAANREFMQVLETPEHRDQIVLALRSLGCNLGAVEFFRLGSRLVFLEVNTMWGKRHQLGQLDFYHHLLSQEAELADQLPYVYQWLDRESYYTRLFEKIHAHALGVLG